MSLVSIITPSYNCEEFISDTINSVISQTYENWEMIIVDDCSSDSSTEIIERYILKDDRIKLLRNEINSGPAVSRNNAINEAKGKYIAFLDADDFWMPEKLESQIFFMEANGVSLSYSSYETMDEEGKKLGIVRNPLEKLDYNELLKENQIGCLTAVYNREKLGKCYMPIIHKRQDYGLWLSILKKIDFAYKVPGNLAVYRIQTNSVSSNKIDLLKHNYRLFRDVEKLSVSQSVYFVGWNIIRKYKQVKRRQ